MKTVAIIYGWAEGPWQGRRFVQALEKDGLQVVKNSRTADIIICHSAGCYLVPNKNRAQIILLIGLPFWPGRSLISGIVRKIAAEIKYHRRHNGLGWWTNKIFHNTWYILSQPQKTYYYTTYRYKEVSLPQATHTKVLVVRASQDTFLEPTAAKKLTAARHYLLAELPGAHDDCWFKPQPYIDLLLEEL